jgi:hypothetical protein
VTVTSAGITPCSPSAWQVIAVEMHLQVCKFPELIVTHCRDFTEFLAECERTALNLIELLKKSTYFSVLAVSV